LKNQPSSASVPLSVEPSAVDFGCLRPGEDASATLRVSGGPVSVVVVNDQLTVSPVSLGAEGGTLQLRLLKGTAGQLVWDCLVLQATDRSLEVPVTAYWHEASGEQRAEAATPPVEECGVDKTDGAFRSERTYKGRSCRYCGSNLRYDASSGIWHECQECRGMRKVFSLVARFSRELGEGFKESRAILAETWEALKEKEKRSQ
jgi:hypothetical protein